jgi:hydroxymethylglutaryl-CoA synthase
VSVPAGPAGPVGIRAYGAYIPMSRLSLGRGEKAAVGNDEDSLTMAVAASIDCLRCIDRSTIDALFFASTTRPFLEKQGAALIARALDLRRDIITADYDGSLRAGTSALRGAVDAVRAGSARSVLVVASDCRLASPGSPLESKLGDAAAAMLVADTDPIATFDAAYAIADEILDVWRSDGDSVVRSWEERFVAKHGARDNLVEAVQGLGRKVGHAPRDYDRAVLYGFDAREHGEVARALGLDPARVQDPLFGKVGNAGAAFVPLLLAAALEQARPGERLLVAAYGDGAEAFSLATTAQADRPRACRGVAWHIAHRRAVQASTYWPARTASARPAQGGAISATKHWRERDEDLSFKARRCRGCGTLHFPAQRVCIRCFKKDDFEPVRLSDRRGKLLCHTVDYFHPSPEPPTLAGVVEVEGGCRIWLQLTEMAKEDLRLELPVEFSFRRIHQAGGMPNYFWKSVAAQLGAA